MKRTLFAITACATTLAFGGDFIQWTDTSVSLLAGTGFEVDPEDQTTVTLEHANGWKWGDFFWFHDAIYYNGEVNGDNGKMSYYGEISPRVSLGKVLGKDLSVAFIKDWLFAYTYEYGEDPTGKDFGIKNHLVGAGVDLDVPAFDFVQLNVYQRLPETGDGETVQVTAAWKYSTPAGKSTFICDGFLDWVINSDGTYSDNLHFCPQVKFDVGTIWGWKAGRLHLGIEYDYWKNKYGLDFANEQHAVSALVKSHF